MNTKIKAFSTLSESEYSNDSFMILPQLNFDIWIKDGDYCLSIGWICFMVEFWFGNLKHLI
jgi:hypothetical protein